MNRVGVLDELEVLREVEKAARRAYDSRDEALLGPARMNDLGYALGKVPVGEVPSGEVPVGGRMSCSLEAEGGRCLTCEAFRAGRGVAAAEVVALRDQREVSREATVVEKHLWEVKHSYRCEEREYHSGEGPVVYDSWSHLEGDLGPLFEPDLNLVFRWDWDKESQVLRIHFVQQRRGRYRSIEVRGMREEDEPAVRRWLAPRWGHMQRMWNPISEMPSAEIEAAEHRIQELEARVRSLSARLVAAVETYPRIREGLEQVRKGSTGEGLENIREASYTLYGLRGED